ncbi:MAG: glutathione S-transferase C-terminal domain-containing protein [Cyanobacteria bacterium]|nr:glutathione S-transferase C-terminal domain-containing protein [Cyanobacteriota bacterium]
MAPPRFPKASLPPGLIVRTGRTVWKTLWQVMMSRLAPTDKAGSYVRPESQFRQRIDADGAYPAAADRYRLIVGLGCPWAHRTLVVRALKGLEHAVPIWRVNPSADEGFWVFEPEQALAWRSLPDLYQTAQPGYTGRSTVPLLWDTQSRTVVNNESADMIEILNGAFNAFAQRPGIDLYPATLKTAIDEWGDRIYHAVNNGVYRCGFARTQAAYEDAGTLLFDTLDQIDQRLANQRYLCGDSLTLADVRLFTTLFRFDGVYHGLFKCDRRHIRDFEHLWPYARDIYQQPGVAATCDLETVRREYYGNLFPLNPGGLIPLGPDPALWEVPHGRG